MASASPSPQWTNKVNENLSEQTTTNRLKFLKGHSSALFSSTDSSWMHSFVTGRIRVPLGVFTSAIQTLPSLLGNASSIHPRGQYDCGTSSPFKRTRSSSLRFLFTLFHFERIVKVDRYSLCHLRHIMSASAWAILNLLQLLISHSSKWPGGPLGYVCPIRTWFGVSAS